jgi:hypothetical protein
MLALAVLCWTPTVDSNLPAPPSFACVLSQLWWDGCQILQHCFAARYYPRINASTLVLTKHPVEDRLTLKLGCLEYGGYWSDSGTPHVREGPGLIGHADEIAEGETVKCYLSVSG